MPVAPRHAWLRWASIACAALTALLAVATSAAAENRFDDGGVLRMAIGTGLLTLSGSLALVVLAKLSARDTLTLPPAPAAAALDRVKLECPRCARPQTVPAGDAGALCPGCRLHIAVHIHTARCGACNYPLDDLRTDRCPECGAPVTA
jgi:Zn finger protein HypA/HybF involved in hydrogenase expression